MRVEDEGFESPSEDEGKETGGEVEGRDGVHALSGRVEFATLFRFCASGSVGAGIGGESRAGEKEGFCPVEGESGGFSDFPRLYHYSARRGYRDEKRRSFVDEKGEYDALRDEFDHNRSRREPGETFVVSPKIDVRLEGEKFEEKVKSRG